MHVCLQVSTQYNIIIPCPNMSTDLKSKPNLSYVTHYYCAHLFICLLMLLWFEDDVKLLSFQPLQQLLVVRRQLAMLEIAVQSLVTFARASCTWAMGGVLIHPAVCHLASGRIVTPHA